MKLTSQNEMTPKGEAGSVTVIRAAITQTTWTGDKKTMLDKHEQFARDAKARQADRKSVV